MSTRRSHSGIFLFILIVSLYSSLTLAVQINLISIASPQSLNVRKDAISMSGVSSGACMATQYHVAHSSQIMGVGLISGAPYWCAEFNVYVALEACMKSPNSINVGTLTNAVNFAYMSGTLDSPSYMKNSRVYIFHGMEDYQMVRGVSEKLQDFYAHYVPASNTAINYSLPAAHSFPTKAWGSRCNYFGEPYINNCNFDAAGAILNHVYPSPPLKQPVQFNASNIFAINQETFVPFPFTPGEISLAKMGYVYIPRACSNGTSVCKLHVVLHGCLQNVDSVGWDFIHHTGYNEWAEANDIIILYPQTIVSASIPYNPKGCWDWWGYTGSGYASQIGPQISVLYKMINSFNLISGLK